MTYEPGPVTAALCARAERQLDVAVMYLDRGDRELARAWIGSAKATLVALRAGEPPPQPKLALVRTPEEAIERAYLDATDQLRDPGDEPEEEEPPPRRRAQYDGPPEDDINF